jgi:hypothetical protein
MVEASWSVIQPSWKTGTTGVFDFPNYDAGMWDRRKPTP